MCVEPFHVNGFKFHCLAFDGGRKGSSEDDDDS